MQFQDGTDVEGDVLVGADGIHSVIRQALFPDVALRYSGKTCYRSIATMELAPALARTCWEVRGGESRFGFLGTRTAAGLLVCRCFHNRLLAVGSQPLVAKALAIDFEVNWILWRQI